jgi:AraC-like DNA-binding protein
MKSNQMILLLRGSHAQVKVLKKSTLLVMCFDMFLPSCDRHLLRSYLPYLDKIKYDFKPTPIPPPMSVFLKQFQYFREMGIDCRCYNDLKHREFSILMQRLCTREEIISFLHPLIGDSLQFRSKVLEKNPLVGDGDVTTLAGLVGMGRKTFDKRFRDEFGTSPAKWMKDEKAKHLRIRLSEPGVTIADVIDEFQFSSANQLNRFCLQHYSMTPGKMIKEATKIEKIIDKSDDLII